MGRSGRSSMWWLAVALLATVSASAQTDGALRVAVPDAPPFAEPMADGTWSGLGVELAEQIGEVLGRPVRIVAIPTDSSVGTVADGAADLVLTSATARSEAEADLTGPFYTARLGVARMPRVRIADVAGRVLSPTFFKIVGGLIALLFVVGVAIWLFERHQDADDFAEGKAGIWDGFWWSGVTMTTIGYGDTVPETVGGRSLALLWMLLSMGITAALTTALVSALNLGEGGDTRIPDSLQGDRVGVVEGSVAARVLAEAGTDTRAYASVADGLAALDADSLDAFADSAPRLRATRSSESDVEIHTTGVDLDRWAFAVATDSPLREPVARAVLERVQSPGWDNTVRRYIPSY